MSCTYIEGSMNSYPLPAHAVSVWLAGDRLMIGIPPVNGDERPSTKVIPLDRCFVDKNAASQTGWRFLLNLLSERTEMIAQGKKPYLGTKGDPVQYDIEKMLKHMRREKREHRKVVKALGKDRPLTLEDLGL
jgi:hypothetical protein